MSNIEVDFCTGVVLKPKTNLQGPNHDSLAHEAMKASKRPDQIVYPSKAHNFLGFIFI